MGDLRVGRRIRDQEETWAKVEVWRSPMCSPKRPEICVWLWCDGSIIKILHPLFQAEMCKRRQLSGYWKVAESEEKSSRKWGVVGMCKAMQSCIRSGVEANMLEDMSKEWRVLRCGDCVIMDLGGRGGWGYVPFDTRNSYLSSAGIWSLDTR